MPPLRLVFAGTPAFAAIHLQALLASPHEVLAAYTRPDQPSGRGNQLTRSPVKSLALENGIAVVQPTTLRNQAEQHKLSELNADLMVVVAYGLILPKEVLTAPKYGCINVHASLLPRWRGAAPIERAILAGDKETGVTIMQMDEGLDTGNMLYSQTLPITARDNRQTIETALAELGANTLLFVLNNLSTLLPTSTPQQESLSTYAPKMQKQEALINWNSNAEHISRQVRAGIGRYPAYTLLANERIRIIDGTVSNDRADQPPGTILCASRDLLRVACLENSFDIKTLQVPGRTPVSVEAFMNSHQQSFQPGKVFQSTEPGVV